MALNGYSEKEPFKGDGADVPTSTVVSQRSSGADSRHSRFSVKPVGSSANTFEPASGSLSIVIPTLNAEDEIHGCLSSSLFVPTAKGLIKEVIVSDGGSTDQTKLIAESMGAHWIDTPIGRGAQLAAGAEAATGQWLLLLHADTWLTAAWAADAMRHVMNSPENAAVFRLADRSDSKKAKWLARTANWRSRVQSGVKGRGAEAAVGDVTSVYR